MARSQHFTLSEPPLAGNMEALIHMHRPKLRAFQHYDWPSAAVGSAHRWPIVKSGRRAGRAVSPLADFRRISVSHWLASGAGSREQKMKIKLVNENADDLI